MEDNEGSASWTQNSDPTQTTNPIAPRLNVEGQRAILPFLQTCNQIITDCRQNHISRTNAIIRLFSRRDDKHRQPRFDSINNLNRSIATYINLLNDICWENSQATHDVGNQWQIVDDDDETDDASGAHEEIKSDGDDNGHDSGALSEWPRWTKKWCHYMKKWQ